MKRNLYGLFVLAGLAAFLFSACISTPRIGQTLRPDDLRDGVYRGSYKGGPNTAAVEVTISGGKITRIDIIEHDHWKGAPAETVIPGRIIQRQSTLVDAVSGATNSSTVIMNAVQKAVEEGYGR